MEIVFEKTRRNFYDPGAVIDGEPQKQKGLLTGPQSVFVWNERSIVKKLNLVSLHPCINK